MPSPRALLLALAVLSTVCRGAPKTEGPAAVRDVVTNPPLIGGPVRI